MAYDGTLKFNTAIDAKGFQNGVKSIAGMAEKGLKATTEILTGAGAAISAMATAAVKVGSDFEGAMSKVEAISGAAGSDLKALTDKAKEMGSATKFSATESANAFEYMAMAGWKTEDMLNGIEGIMNLAAASGEDLAATSDIVTDALTAFGLSAQDSTHFADILAQASSNANTNVGMMGETFKYVAPVAGALGYSAEDTATAIGLMANSGIKASQAGTALRSMLTRLAKPTEESKLAMEELGISIDDGEGNMKSFKEIMDDLRSGFGELMISQDEFNERLSSLNSNLVDGTLSQKEYDAEIERLIGLAYGAEGAEKAKYAAMLAGQEAMSGLLAIVNASEDDFNKLTESIYSCDGAAAQMAETMNDNLQGQLTILKSGLEGLGISFYESVQAPLKDIAIEAQGMVQQLQDAFDTGGLDGMVTAFGDILAQTVERIAGAAPELIDTAAGLVSSFCESLKNSEGIGEAAASLISSLVTALLSCTGDIWTTAIVLIDNAAKGLASELPTILQQGIDLVLELGKGIAEAIPELVPIAVECILDLVDTFFSNIDTVVEVGFQIVMALAEGIVRAVPVLLQKIPEIIKNIFLGSSRSSSEHLALVQEVVSSKAGEIAEAISNWFSQLPRRIGVWFTKIVNGVTLWGSEMLSAASAAVNNVIANVVAFFSELPDNIAYWLGYAAGSIVKWGIDLHNWVTNEVPQIIDNIVTFFSELPDKVWIWLLDTVNRAQQWGMDLLITASDAAVSAVNKVSEWFSQLPAKVAAWLLETVGRAVQFAVDLKAKADTAARGFFNNLVDGIKGLPDKFREIGSNIVDGIWDGISSGWNWLIDKVKSLASSLFKGAKDALGINSPSRVFAREVGRWIPPGIGVGIDEAMPDLESQMGDEMDRIAQKMQTAVEVETGKITVNTKSKAQHTADIEYPVSGGDTYIDEHIEQENNYHVPVATPSETSKAGREAVRKLLNIR